MGKEHVGAQGSLVAGHADAFPDRVRGKIRDRGRRLSGRLLVVASDLPDPSQLQRGLRLVLRRLGGKLEDVLLGLAVHVFAPFLAGLELAVRDELPVGDEDRVEGEEEPLHLAFLVFRRQHAERDLVLSCAQVRFAEIQPSRLAKKAELVEVRCQIPGQHLFPVPAIDPPLEWRARKFEADPRPDVLVARLGDGKCVVEFQPGLRHGLRHGPGIDRPHEPLPAGKKFGMLDPLRFENFGLGICGRRFALDPNRVGIGGSERQGKDKRGEGKTEC